MRIKYLGHSCFQIETSGIKIITDPYTKVGYELEKGLTADVVTLSHQHFDHNYVAAIQSDFVCLKDATKREISGVTFEGIKTFHDPEQGRLRGENILFKIQAENITLCHFGDLGEACREELLKKIGKVDVLLLPIGGTYTIDAAQAVEYVKRLNPAIVIPMHYRPKDGALDIADEQAFLSTFDKANIAFVGCETEIAKKDVEESNAKIIFMERGI